MPDAVGYYDSTYRQFETDVLAAVRRESHDEDIGQNSWLNASELRDFLGWLGVGAQHHVLEIACGSGGPACYVVQTTGCSLTGIDSHDDGIAAATERAARLGLTQRTRFLQGDANAPLQFADATFDAVICVDAINHLRDRRAVLAEWRRVLRPGGGVLFTDPVVITGPVSNADLATRASIGFFLFLPPGNTDRLLIELGFQGVRVHDASNAAAEVSIRRREARARYRDELVAFEGPERFEASQAFLQCVHDLSASRQLSRIVYHAVKPTT